MTGSSPMVIAHRGASAAAPENTLEAYRLAVELGADGVELDARRTADGAVCVHHDFHLPAPDGPALVDLAVGDLPASVPSLAAALDACEPLVVNIEIKNSPDEPDFDASEQVANQVVDEVRRRGAQDKVLVSSFRIETIDRIRALDPTIGTAFLVGWEPDHDALVRRTVEHGHGFLHPWDGMVGADLIGLAHDAGLLVNVWTVDDPARMAELIGFGVDGLVTNVPDIGRRVVDASDVRTPASTWPTT